MGVRCGVVGLFEMRSKKKRREGGGSKKEEKREESVRILLEVRRGWSDSTLV